MAKLQIATLGGRAKGTFGPGDSQALDPRIVEVLRGDKFLRPATQLFVGGCGDERLDNQGQRLLLPPVFAGFFALVLADALTTQLWYRPGMSAQGHAMVMAREVHRLFPRARLCVHTDTNAGQECGCAAIAKAPAVLSLLASYPDLIDVRYRESILLKIKRLLADGYFGPGTTALVDGLQVAGVAKEVLHGPHDGLLAVRNCLHGHVYDRPAFYRWCQVESLPLTPFFEYDEWSMRATAEALMKRAGGEGDSQHFFAAGNAFNLAVLYAICNRYMPVLVRG